MKISVIIPVYNVEKYLRQCLDSVINQTYKNLEIICINDASTDNSLEILKEYAQKDSRIILLDNEVNLHVGISRNRGLEIATGEYIHFLDSDDWMELDAYEKLVSYIEKSSESIDILHFLSNFKALDNRNSVIMNYQNPELVGKLLNIEDTPDLINNFVRSSWLNIYRKGFLEENNIIFNNYPSMEDVEFHVLILIKARTVLLTNEYLLNYRINNSLSLTGRMHQFYEYSIKSYIVNCQHCETLNPVAKERLLEFEFFDLLNVLYCSFARNVISLNEVREILSSLDMSIFSSEYSRYKWFTYYNDLVNCPAIWAKFKYFLRRFLKNYFYGLFLAIKNYRSKHK